MLRKYEPVICRKSTTPAEYNSRVVVYRRQRRIGDLMSTSLETHEQAVNRVQSELNNDLKSLTRSQIWQLAECFPSCGRRNFTETLQKRIAEAQSENLNLNQYAKQSQPVVLLYWCCARDKEHFDDNIKNTWLVTESGDEQPPTGHMAW